MRNAIYLAGTLVLCLFAPSMSAQAALADRPRTPVATQAAGGDQSVPPLKRPVTLVLRDVPLVEAIRAIDRQADLQLGYTDRLLPAGKRVTLVAEKLTAGKALARVLEGTGLVVRLSADGQLTLARGRRSATSQAAGSIAGRVTDAETKRSIAGAEVLLGGTQWRTTTDTSGRYRLADVDPGVYTLLVRRPGYAQRSRRVTVEAEQEDTIDVVLEAKPIPLEELVTTATGRQRRRDLGNAITTIHADSVLKTAAIRNLTDLLEDRVAGLTVQHSTGAPGDPARLRLRGLNSVLRSNDPIVFVDGVRVYAAQSEARSGNLTNACNAFNGNDCYGATVRPAPSPLDQIDPNTIETIDVFKGPSAATMYGADAANGVIVITTKKGRPGPTRWTGNATARRTTSPGRYPTGYYRWGHDLIFRTPRFCTLVDLSCIADSLVTFQALNVPALTVLGDHGTSTALSLSASGGSQSLMYSVTGSYSTETGPLALPQFEIERFRTIFNRDAPGWMRRPHEYTTWSVTSNVTARLSPVAQVVLNTSLSRYVQQRTSLENQLGPLMGTYVDTVNGIYYRPGDAISYALDRSNDILRDYYEHATATGITFTTGLSGDWRPRSWFTATGRAGLNVIPRDDQTLLPTYLAVDAAGDSGKLVRGTGQSLVSTLDLLGTLRKTLGHGFRFETNFGAGLTGTRTTDLTTFALGLVPGTAAIGGAKRIGGADARVNTSSYGWYVEPRITGERLSLSTGLRLDGGNAYGTRVTGLSGHGGGFLRSLLSLPKLNGSWVVSEEPWFPFAGLFSSLRLRGAYGQAQVQPGPADRLRLYDNTIALTSLGNSRLRPERSTEFEGGFDADVLDSRLSLEVSLYRKLQVDALMPVSLPSSVNGGGAVLTNVGNVRNTGMEISLGMTPVKLPAVMWAAQLHYSRNNNILTELGPGVLPNPREGLVAGYPVHSRWERPIIGFADENDNGVLDQNEIQVGDSLVYMGRLLPAYTMSLFTSVALFDNAVGVSAGFSYDAGQTQVNNPAAANWVLARALVDPGAPLSEQAAVLAVDRRGATYTSTNYGLMQEVSTFRFNSLSVNYRAPAAITRFVRAQTLSVAVQGENLGLHSTYRGKDPDVNAWSPGEGVQDTGQLPLPRTWQLSIYVTY